MIEPNSRSVPCILFPFFESLASPPSPKRRKRYRSPPPPEPELKHVPNSASSNASSSSHMKDTKHNASSDTKHRSSRGGIKRKTSSSSSSSASKGVNSTSGEAVARSVKKRRSNSRSASRSRNAARGPPSLKVDMVASQPTSIATAPVTMPTDTTHSSSSAAAVAVAAGTGGTTPTTRALFSMSDARRQSSTGTAGSSSPCVSPHSVRSSHSTSSASTTSLRSISRSPVPMTVSIPSIQQAASPQMQNLALVSAAEASALVASQGNPDQFAKPQNIFRRSTSSNRGSSGSAPHAPSPRAGRAVGAQEDPTKSMLTNAWPTVDGAKSAKAFAEQAEFLSRLVSLNPSLTFSQQTPNASQLNARQKNPFRPSIATATSTLTTPSVSSAPSPRASAAVVSSAPKLPPVKRSATTPKASSGGHFGFSTMTKHNLLSSTQLVREILVIFRVPVAYVHFVAVELCAW